MPRETDGAFKGQKARIKFMKEAVLKEIAQEVTMDEVIASAELTDTGAQSIKMTPETCNSFLAINHKKCLEALAQQKQSILTEIEKIPEHNPKFESDEYDFGLRDMKKQVIELLVI